MADYNQDNIPTFLCNGDTITFNYTGNVATLPISVLKYAENIKIECWGAAGTGHAKGGYAYGNLKVSSIPEKISNLYFVVGERVANENERRSSYGKTGAFGGGGTGHSDGGSMGGGASDVRTYYDPNDEDNSHYTREHTIDKGTQNTTSLKSRIIVAAGGGGCDHAGGCQGCGAHGGGWSGYGGSQTGPGGGSYNRGAGFGFGGAVSEAAVGGGGGGFYGGGASNGGGGGGSSYVSGNSNCPYETPSGIKFYESNTTPGIQSGNGLIKLTVLSGSLSLSPYNIYSYIKSTDTTYKTPIYISSSYITNDKNIVNIEIKGKTEKYVSVIGAPLWT